MAPRVGPSDARARSRTIIRKTPGRINANFLTRVFNGLAISKTGRLVLTGRELGKSQAASDARFWRRLPYARARVPR
jgi:hypothetical protein